MDKISDKLRNYLKDQDITLHDRANNLWSFLRPVFDRQNKVNSNENGIKHVEMVEYNLWRLIRESNKVLEFTNMELFIFSCSACCHDLDKGLYEKLPENHYHGNASEHYLKKNIEKLQLLDPEVCAIGKIIGIHDLPKKEFKEELNKIQKTFPLSKGPLKLQQMAVLLKTADILHTDNSRISPIGIDFSSLNEIQKKKHMARESITGWKIDGSRIVFFAIPKTKEHLEAVNECISYIKENEWPSVEEKLSDYDFPYKIEFKTDTSSIPNSTESEKKSLNKKNNINSIILFNNYKKDCEKYYLERDVDKRFFEAINYGNTWIYGESGSGKTALINRNLICNDLEFVFCDMSPLTIENSKDVLDEILYSLLDRYNLKNENHNENIIKKICKTLNSIGIEKDIFIVIDEFSINSIDLYKEIASSFVKLANYYSKCSVNIFLKLIVSTTRIPKEIIDEKEKASELFEYIDVNHWEDYSEKLFILLNDSLNLEISNSDKKLILKKSNNSPRIIKNIFRKIIRNSNMDIEDIVQLVIEESL